MKYVKNIEMTIGVDYPTLYLHGGGGTATFAVVWRASEPVSDRGNGGVFDYCSLVDTDNARGHWESHAMRNWYVITV